MYANIQITFLFPGDWGNFILRAHWLAAGGYKRRDTYTPGDLQPEHAAAMSVVVGTLVALDQPWQARRVGITLERIEPEPEAPEPFTPYEQLSLTIHARHVEDGSPRDFTPADYPQLRLTDAASLAAFKALTHLES